MKLTIADSTLIVNFSLRSLKVPGVRRVVPVSQSTAPLWLGREQMRGGWLTKRGWVT